MYFTKVIHAQFMFNVYTYLLIYRETLGKRRVENNTSN